jgi:hypothetical protein
VKINGILKTKDGTKNAIEVGAELPKTSDSLMQELEKYLNLSLYHFGESGAKK